MPAGGFVSLPPAMHRHGVNRTDDDRPYFDGTQQPQCWDSARTGTFTQNPAPIADWPW